MAARKARIDRKGYDVFRKKGIDGKVLFEMRVNNPYNARLQAAVASVLDAELFEFSDHGKFAVATFEVGPQQYDRILASLKRRRVQSFRVKSW